MSALSQIAKAAIKSKFDDSVAEKKRNEIFAFLDAEFESQCEQGNIAIFCLMEKEYCVTICGHSNVDSLILKLWVEKHKDFVVSAQIVLKDVMGAVNQSVIRVVFREPQ